MSIVFFSPLKVRTPREKQKVILQVHVSKRSGNVLMNPKKSIQLFDQQSHQRTAILVQKQQKRKVIVFQRFDSIPP
jgi:hypothetical protein